MKFDFTLSTPIVRSFRVAKVETSFDVPAAEKSTVHLAGDIPIEDLDYSIGVVVGSSGSGKSSLCRHLWPDNFVEANTFDWSAPSVLDDFPAAMPVDDVIGALSAVGFSSTPAWLRPFKVLSTGQRFRAELARAICTRDLIVYDEFTSVVDRVVAKAASVAVAKYVRRSGKRFVAVTCHRDVLDWLEADWEYDTDEQRFRRCLRRRPPVQLQIHMGDRSAWPAFRGHHYLSGSLTPASKVYLAYVRLGDEGPWRLAGFFAVISVMQKEKGWRRGHRTVVLPDFQGLGIGNRMVELVAEELYRREGLRYRATTSSPAIVHHRRRHPEMWRLVQPPVMKGAGGWSRGDYKTSVGRLTCSWVFIPESLRKKNPLVAG
jgi:GNAT superfamily N-acetyltransferase